MTRIVPEIVAGLRQHAEQCADAATDLMNALASQEEPATILDLIMDYAAALGGAASFAHGAHVAMLKIMEGRRS